MLREKDSYLINVLKFLESREISQNIMILAHMCIVCHVCICSTVKIIKINFLVIAGAMFLKLISDGRT